MIDWQPRARALVQELAAQGQLTDARWIEAFANVPRHVFVPRFYGEDHSIVDGEVPAQRDAWLDALYQDSTLVTQIAPVPGTDLLWSTSSSTAPSLMARMLELLDVSDGDRVLEIGTGTGYNAAVLCHRLTDAQVASIDLDPILIADARDRLATLGYRPHLVAGDGTLGIAGAAPYDRIIATCAVPTIPPAWISQLAPDGLIVADVRGEIASSLVTLRKTDDQTVQGRFLSSPGNFMWLRAKAGNPLRDGGTYGSTWTIDDTRQRMTHLDPAGLDDPNLRFVLQQLAPDIQAMYRTDSDGTDVIRIRADDGCWAEVAFNGDNGRHPVTEVGTRSIWATAEHAARWWREHGQPARSRFGMTATAAGTRRIWLDDPSTSMPS